LAVAVTCGLWWSYFRQVRQDFEHTLRRSDGHTRSRLARDVFSVLHFPMLCGVIAMAAATADALAHPDEPLAVGARAALGAGAVLFVCGTALAAWRATGRVLAWRSVLAPVGAAVVLGAGTIPWVAMATLLVVLVAISVVEHWQLA
jgi:low temperature requirement protein LtrA